MTNNEKLNVLNSYRVAQGKVPVKSWHNRYANELNDAIAANDAARERRSRKGDTTPAHKVFKSFDRSTRMSPVAYVHEFLSSHATMKRKEAIFALTQKGINYSTARTQYQRWFANNANVE